MFFTGFKDYAALEVVYSALQPTATTMVCWSQVQRYNGKQTHNVAYAVFRDESVALIDQLFMFLRQVRQGFFEQHLAFCSWDSGFVVCPLVNNSMRMLGKIR